MLFDNGIEDLLDDGFEGSKLERSIFRETFFRNDIGNTSKKCLVTGAINFECESSRNADGSICSNSENSAITSHSSSKNASLEGLSNVTEELREASELENFSKTSATVKQNGQEVTGKEIKSPVYEFPNAEPDSRKVSSAFPENNASGLFYRAADPVSEVVTLRLVECSSQGLTSSCYLLKQHGEIVRGITLGESHVPKCQSVSLEGNDGKEVIVGKTIASPVSQESIASRLFAASPAVYVQERSESSLHAVERPQEPDNFELNISDAALKENLKKDPRPVLQFHVVGLLCAAGWHIERRKRPSRNYMESVYRMPNGRAIREFAKAWRFCGELLSVDRYSSVGEHDSKQWSNISHFLSDLSDTLVNLDKETNRSELAYRWRLLDPFVVVALINRKIGALRKGELVKAAQSPRTDGNSRSDILLPLSNSGSVNHQTPKGEPPTSFSGSGESALVVFEGNCNGCFQQSTSWLPTSLPAHRTGSTVVQSTSCLCDISVHQDGTTKCQICNKLSSDRNAETINEVNSLENNDELLGGQVIDSEHNLLKSGDDCPNSTTQGLVPFQGLDVVRHSFHVEEEDRQAFKASKPGLVDSFSPGDSVLKKKMRRKSKRISEIEPSSSQSGKPVSTSVDEADLLRFNKGDNHLELNQEQGELVANARTRGTCKKSLYVNSSSLQIEKKVSRLKRNRSDYNDSKIVKKKSTRCHIEDDDLLVSAIIKNKDFSPAITTRQSSRKKACKSRAWRKRKSQKRTCRLLPSLVNGGKHFKDGKWYSVGVRTVLSWLIGTGVVSLNDVIQYRSPIDNAVVKDGLITRDGIFCKCCSKLFTVSAFRIHAGFKLNRPCLNLFMESGKPFTLCQLQAWSAEYKTRKGGAPAVQVDNDDRNDDSCGHCGDGGELICCDNCPSTFHHACLSTQDLPEGSWYCPNCACWICGSLVNDNEVSSASYGLKCFQCEHKYHDACLKEMDRYQGAISDSWFCGRNCQEVYSGLQSRVGVTNHVGDEFTWSLLKCIHDDQKVHSAQRFALKAECNSRLSVALTIMEECFLSMVDPRTGIDMIPHVLYNWGSNFARLNFQGFYTVVLEKDDVLISVASIRVHGTTVAEMPLIATCSKYRRQGMCRILVNAIEEMLLSVKVEKIVVAAIPDLVETWTKGFGYKPVEESEKRSLSKINLMVFPGTVLLKKTLYDNGNDAHAQPGDASGLTAVITKVESVSSKMEPRDESKQPFNENSCGNGARSKLENDGVCYKSREFESGRTIKVIGGEVVDGVFRVGIVESAAEVGVHSNETMIKSDAKEPQPGVGCVPIRIGAGTEATLVRDEGIPRLDVGAEVKSPEPINPYETSSFMQVGEAECEALRDQFSKMSCEDPIAELGNSVPRVASDVESLGMYETQLSLDEKSLEKACDVIEVEMKKEV